MTTFGYDELGRKKTVKSKSSGTTTFEYNGFGEVVKETDGNNLVHIYKHD